MIRYKYYNEWAKDFSSFADYLEWLGHIGMFLSSNIGMFLSSNIGMFLSSNIGIKTRHKKRRKLVLDALNDQYVEETTE